jgi:hypothetical protein
MLHPRAVEVVKDLATEHGVCTRPVSLRRTDLDTGATELVDLPCGATRQDKCPSCAARARRLRRQQIREGWHRTDEPLPPPRPATGEQAGLVTLRAHLEYDRAQTLIRPMDPDTRTAEIADIDAAITELEEEITLTGLRGRTAPAHEPAGPAGGRRVRSTRRRQDAPDLPRRPIESRTVGREYRAPEGKTYRPSLFLTLTLPPTAGSRPMAPRPTPAATTTRPPPGTRSTSPDYSTGSGRTYAAPPAGTSNTPARSNHNAGWRHTRTSRYAAPSPGR